MSPAFGAMVLVPNLACEHHEPPGWDAGVGSLSAVPLPEVADAGGGGGNDSAHPGETDAPTVDPGTLPQTRERPKTNTSAFEARAHALWDAIVADDPDLASTAFFPRSAYAQVKAIPSPDVDWRVRLVGNFNRDIHNLHGHLGSHASEARFTELDVATERGRWVEPNEETNKVGYWRVYGSKIRYEVGNRAASFDVSSLISWRGEWYVVHLSGFK